MPRRKGGNFLTNAWAEVKSRLPGAEKREAEMQARVAAEAEQAKRQGTVTAYNTQPSASPPHSAPPTRSAFYTGRPALSFGGRTSKIGRKFDRCVKAVRKTVRARKGSSKESAAIAICTKSVLQTRGRTLKRYKKGRLTTQKRFRGGRA
jgi:hypothetical protein